MEFEIEDRPGTGIGSTPRVPPRPVSSQLRRPLQRIKRWSSQDCALVIPEQEFGS